MNHLLESSKNDLEILFILFIFVIHTKKMAKKSKGRINVVYSTNPDYDYEDELEDNPETLPNNQQNLKVYHDRKARKGKTATIVDGFIGTPEDLKDLEKMLKAKCGVGGSSKDGQIIIQGELRDKIHDILQNEGFKVKKSGG